jgi:glycosyltransferase involved in cell wall biosynthesis
MAVRDLQGRVTHQSMTNVVMLVRDRPRLTEQCLRTLYETTPEDQFNLVIVNDGSGEDTYRLVLNYTARKDNCRVVSLFDSIGIVGWLRNTGIQASERYFGRGSRLYLSDNDVAFTPHWLREIENCWCRSDAKVLGGYRHPFHQPNLTRFGVDYTDAVAGYSMLIAWGTWDRYGPFDSHAKGVCQSEDFAFCQKIIKDGGKVGYMREPVIAMCGITNSEGKSAIGSEHFPRIPGLIYE